MLKKEESEVKDGEEGKGVKSTTTSPVKGGGTLDNGQPLNDSTEPKSDVEDEDASPETLAIQSTKTSATFLLDSLRKMMISSQSYAKNTSKLAMREVKDYKFWSTQPVPSIGEKVMENGPIKSDIPMDSISTLPLTLPKDFEWCVVDVQDPAQLKELYQLLSLNYVEDQDAVFRFDYSASFLAWALKPPGWNSNWHVGVRVASGSKKLVAFIAGMPMTLAIHDQPAQFFAEINFLCVHKKLRSKRLAPVLIKEITRRINLTGTFQAVYTAGVFLPKPISACRYWHRSLRPKKLIETGFSGIPNDMTIAKLIQKHKLPEATATPGLRPMTNQDISRVHELVNLFLSKFPFRPVFSVEEVAHHLMPIPETVFTYVGTDDDGVVVDFVSFYSLPSSVIGNPKHSHLQVAYLFYYSPRDEDPATLHRLIQDAMTLAYEAGFDVFNCLDILSNSSFLEDLKFGKGDGTLHYYLYNYRCVDVAPTETALVML